MEDKQHPRMDKVLHTTELLEAILLHLPIKELLITSSLVCKEWQATIATSPRLQQALFLMPLSRDSLQYLCRNWNSAWEAYEGDPHAYTVFINPFFDYVKAQIYRGVIGSPKHKAMKNPKASWRRMLVTQPPFAGRYRDVTLPDLLIGFGEQANYMGEKSWRLDGDRFPGMTSCREVTVGNDVRRLVRPKAWWM